MSQWPRRPKNFGEENVGYIYIYIHDGLVWIYMGGVCGFHGWFSWCFDIFCIVDGFCRALGTCFLCQR